MNKKSIAMMVLAIFFVAAAMGIQAADLYVTTTEDQVPGSLRAVPMDSYCESSGSNQVWGYISSVVVGDLNNASGASPYSDFTSLFTFITQGETVNVLFYPAYICLTCYGYHYWKIWIDYNGDQDFSDPGEEVFSGSGYFGVTGSFTVPTSTIIGDTRMRVSMSDSDWPPVCGEFGYGEVEDYTVNIYGGGPAITVVSPNGGEDWELNSIHNITWHAAGLSGNLKLNLWKDGALVGTIADNISPATGSYSWRVGQYLGGTAPVGTGYAIEIKELGTTVSDMSNATFLIASGLAVSLREAITIANSNGEDDTIYLPAGLYLLRGAADEDANLSGDLDIDNDQGISIIGMVGPEAGEIIIDANQVDRVIHILKGSVSIEGVTFRNGRASDGGRVASEKGTDGGGIYNCGKLSMTDCSIINNRSGNGALHFWSFNSPLYICPGSGGDGGGIYNSGTLTLNRCTIENNSAGDGGGGLDVCPGVHGGHGGGIYNSSTGTQVLKNCKIIKNKSGSGLYWGDDHEIDNDAGDGGGIYNSGTQYLTHCNISYNSSGRGGGWDSDEGRDGLGGGIFNSGNSTVVTSIIRYNTTSWYVYDPNDPGDYCHPGRGDGAGIYNSGIFKLTGSIIDHNQTSKSGRGGGIFHHQNTFSITQCSITNNNTGNHSGWWEVEVPNGGGIFNESTMTITNCTLSTNKTGDCLEYFGSGGDGGGIYNSATITLINTTICNNTTGKSMHDPEFPGRDGCGGGIYNSSGTVHFKNTIIANNSTTAGGEGPDGWGTLDSLGYNLIENASNCTITGILTGNITGVDPKMGTLKNNGGPTLTYALLPDSPAIDAGYSPGISQDQRGYSRPVDIPGIANVNDASDIGAYELEAVDSITISGNITYGGNGLANVTLTFSDQGGTAASDEEGNYSQAVPYGWTGTVTPTLPNYAFTPASRSYTNVTAAQQDQDYSAAVINPLPPQIVLDRTQLSFGADTAGHQTGMQTLVITNGGGGILTWAICDNGQWLNCTPTSGTGSTAITVTVEPTGLSTGTYTAAITIEATGAVNSPQTVQVTLTVYNAGSVNPPFGSFDTPLEGSVVTGSIPVTGWVIDNLGVDGVKIFRSPVEGEGSGWIYIGDAVRVEGARPDIESLYPDYPENYKAGWGYMMLTNFLPNQGNGTFTLYAQAIDKEGNMETLGTTTITCDNAHAVKPFGAIDTPVQGGTAAGRDFTNWGWALTPSPNTIPIDGSTIVVWVDGVPLGHPVYNQYRQDVASLFPGYNNSSGAGGWFGLDTTAYENGVHTISWSVMDNAGNIDGIGSRYFTIQNLNGSMVQVQEDGNNANVRRTIKSFDQTFSKVWPPAGPPEALFLKKGYNPDNELETLSPDENGQYTIESKELERLVIYLEDREVESESGHYEGCLINGDELKPLPIGSKLDRRKGVFYWQPGPGFLGTFRLVFIKTNQEGNVIRKDVRLNIIPKF